MIASKVLAKGPFLPENIKIKIHKKSNRKIDTYLENQIPEIWQSIQTEAKKKGQVVYDGESYRLDKFIWHKEKLELEVSLIRYSIRNSLNKLSEKLAVLGEDYYSNGLAVGGFIKTTDGKHIFGKRSPSSPTKQRIDFIGGILEEVELRTADNLLQKNREEIQEETGISSEKIDQMNILGLVLSSSTNIIIITSTKLSISSAQVKNIFETVEHEDEMSELVFVDEKDLKQYLLELRGYKTAVVDLLDVI